eukprot:683589-Prymnesium_polylepis.2
MSAAPCRGSLFLVHTLVHTTPTYPTLEAGRRPYTYSKLAVNIKNSTVKTPPTYPTLETGK